jgi:hypothetical protein
MYMFMCIDVHIIMEVFMLDHRILVNRALQ